MVVRLAPHNRRSACCSRRLDPNPLARARAARGFAARLKLENSGFEFGAPVEGESELSPAHRFGGPIPHDPPPIGFFSRRPEPRSRRAQGEAQEKRRVLGLAESVGGSEKERVLTGDSYCVLNDRKGRARGARIAS